MLEIRNEITMHHVFRVGGRGGLPNANCDQTTK